jgi:hypothetical protein
MLKFIHTIPYGPLLLGLLVGAGLGAGLGYFGQCTSGTCPLTSTWWRGAIYGAVLGILFSLSSPGRSLRGEHRAPQPAPEGTGRDSTAPPPSEAEEPASSSRQH